MQELNTPKLFHMKVEYLILLFLPFAGCMESKGKVMDLKPAHSLKDTNRLVGGGCEGCEIMYIGMPEEVSYVHTSPGWSQGRQKLWLTGQVFHRDGRTPASGVLIYYWHTDDRGLYTADEGTPAEARIHGRLRGWIRTDGSGRYAIRTSRPAAYPDQDIAQHIHLSIREPDLPNEYFADLYFEDDPLYEPHRKRYGQADRAGIEILKVRKEGDVQIATHDVILGLNIPDYPVR